MICHCFCHHGPNSLVSKWSECCSACEIPGPTITVADFPKIARSITEIPVPEMNAHRIYIRVVVGDKLQDDRIFSAVYSAGLGAPPEIRTMAYQNLAKSITSYFDDNGWPTIVLQNLAAPLSYAATATFDPKGNGTPSEIHYSAELKWNWAAKSSSWGVQPEYHSTGGEVSGSQIMRDLKRALPGLRSVQDCPEKEAHEGERSFAARGPVYYLVQHLNDHHKWTRNQIADWLETLDVDLSFPDEPVAPELPKAHPYKRLYIVAKGYGHAADLAYQHGWQMGYWSYLPEQEGISAKVILCGTRDPQYALADGANPGPRLEEALDACGAVQVSPEMDRSIPPFPGKASHHSGFVSVDIVPANKVTKDLVKQMQSYLTKEHHQSKTDPLTLKKSQAEHQDHLKVNPTKSRRKKN